MVDLGVSQDYRSKMTRFGDSRILLLGLGNTPQYIFQNLDSADTFVMCHGIELHSNESILHYVFNDSR